MLALALPIAHRLGIDPARVTCRVENTASRKVIERNKSVPSESSAGYLRFWLATSPASMRLGATTERGEHISCGEERRF
jgi:hypothetical protein